MLSVLSLSALCLASVKSNALNRASARDFYAYDADYADYDEEYDEEYDAYLMYEEAAENLERAEREFELMTQLLDGGDGHGDDDGDTKKGTKARNSYFDEYYYGGPAAPAAPVPHPYAPVKPVGATPYAARNGYSNSFGDPEKGGEKGYSNPKKTGYSNPKKTGGLYAARNGYSNSFGEPEKGGEKGGEKGYSNPKKTGYSNPKVDPKKTGGLYSARNDFSNSFPGTVAGPGGSFGVKGTHKGSTPRTKRSSRMLGVKGKGSTKRSSRY